MNKTLLQQRTSPKHGKYIDLGRLDLVASGKTKIKSTAVAAIQKTIGSTVVSFRFAMDMDTFVEQVAEQNGLFEGINDHVDGLMDKAFDARIEDGTLHTLSYEFDGIPDASEGKPHHVLIRAFGNMEEIEFQE